MRFALCLSFLLATLGSSLVHAQSVVPLSLSQVRCYPHVTINGENRAERSGGGAYVACGFTHADGHNQFYDTEASASTYYPGSGLPAQASVEAVTTGQRVGTSVSVAEARIRYYLKIQERLPPPFDPDVVPLVAHIIGSYKTVNASAQVAVQILDAGGRSANIFFDISKPLNDSKQIAVDTYPMQAIDEIFGFEKQAFCSTSISGSVNFSSCSATIDPILRFDEERFAGMWGDQAFVLSDFYDIVASPVPEPHAFVLALAGIAVLAGHRRRRCKPMPMQVPCRNRAEGSEPCRTGT